jgi:hypothetical protein
VVLPAVEFDDEAAVRPREVDLFALDEDVGLGPGETAVIEEGVEAGLEVPARVGRWREGAEGSGAALGRVALCQAVGASEAEPFRLVDGLLELMALQDAGEVEEAAGGGGDGDAVVGGDLVGGERLGEGGGLVVESCLSAPSARSGPSRVEGPRVRRPIGG